MFVRLTAKNLLVRETDVLRVTVPRGHQIREQIASAAVFLVQIHNALGSLLGQHVAHIFLEDEQLSARKRERRMTELKRESAPRTRNKQRRYLGVSFRANPSERALPY